MSPGRMKRPAQFILREEQSMQCFIGMNFVKKMLSDCFLCVAKGQKKKQKTKPLNLPAVCIQLKALSVTPPGANEALSVKNTV